MASREETTARRWQAMAAGLRWTAAALAAVADASKAAGFNLADNRDFVIEAAEQPGVKPLRSAAAEIRTRAVLRESTRGARLIGATPQPKAKAVPVFSPTEWQATLDKCILDGLSGPLDVAIEGLAAELGEAVVAAEIGCIAASAQQSRLTPSGVVESVAVLAQSRIPPRAQAADAERSAPASRNGAESVAAAGGTPAALSLRQLDEKAHSAKARRRGKHAQRHGAQEQDVYTQASRDLSSLNSQELVELDQPAGFRCVGISE